VRLLWRLDIQLPEQSVQDFNWKEAVKIVKALEKIAKFIDKINDYVGRVSAFAVLLLMLFVVFEVVSRRFFNAPTIWSFEVVTMLYGFFIIMVAGFGLLHGSIVCIDIFSAKLSAKKQHILSICMYLLFFFPFVTFIIPAAVNFAATSWSMHESSWSQWAPPVYPIKTVIPVAFIFLWLQGLSEIIKSILFLTGRSPVPESLGADPGQIALEADLTASDKRPSDQIALATDLTASDKRPSDQIALETDLTDSDGRAPGQIAPGSDHADFAGRAPDQIAPDADQAKLESCRSGSKTGQASPGKGAAQ
jgi:TRAP-type mannitol/chloroaromatic compound transport system permease small subunit